ncbi:nucleotidyltransferase [Gluconacetobacter sacchari DSM 12717]|uniref:DNA-directed DNA polymerase n=1 Tax=Gluconacetobacter sacchari DSM 12717 TaxID=1307940 RepID=A0ABQ0P6H1_9PROT|nr:nucleotidyltransferase [Gluconacetobacter sacchari DSM 12717]
MLAADATAQGRGVRVGMTLAHAQSLAPDLHATPATPNEDDAALLRFADWCFGFSPIVAPDRPDGIWIDTTGCDHLHGGEAPMLAALREQIAARGYAVRLALADTPGAAHAMARFSGGDISIVPQGGQREAIRRLPIGALRIDTTTVADLRRMGLQTVGAVLEAPRPPLVRRFGASLMTRLDQALGHMREPILPLQPREVIQVQRGFVEPIGTADAIGTVIDTLTPEICAALSQRGLGARLLDLHCHRVDDTVQIVRVGLAAPVHDTGHIARLLHERIETIEPGFGIEAMRLFVTQAERVVAGGSDAALLSRADCGPIDPDLACLVDRLRNRVGPDKVLWLEPRHAHWPEQAQRVRRVGEGKRGAYGKEAGDLLSHERPPRPVRLFSPPAPVAVTSLLPDGAPMQFVWQGMARRIRAADGPERLHGDWWDDDGRPGACRDYWIAEDELGERFWLFRRGDGIHDWSGDRAWFLHGLF